MAAQDGKGVADNGSDVLLTHTWSLKTSVVVDSMAAIRIAATMPTNNNNSEAIIVFGGLKM